ncbi:terminal uridylyltransferase 7-like [Gossypium australe]|uniref:Terminal uridylyltransferase 7-like n=1 Tax=Gossypium australe TaxID=47621 RepID=A0A5B6X2R7_9ROSI|nr:terminal uridylyltransferase 7-like [Gossypium australe]
MSDLRDLNVRKHCGKRYPGKSVEQKIIQNLRFDNLAARGRPSRNARNVSGSQRTTRDTVARSEARAPSRAYAI